MIQKYFFQMILFQQVPLFRASFNYEFFIDYGTEKKTTENLIITKLK